MVQGRKHFADQLKDLNNKVITMGDEVIRTYRNLLAVFENNDLDIAKDIIENDKLINNIEISINVDGYLLIAKQCPVASDLRRIITALKISNDLERIADYTVNIAKYILSAKTENTQFAQEIIKLTNVFLPMLVDIMEAFDTENIKLALDVNDRDEILDTEYQKSVKEMIQIGKETSDEQAEEAFRAVLVLKQIERAGDHVTNIAENIVYLVNGKRVELN